MAARTWDILISTIPHRHAKLVPLLAELDRQAEDGFGALLLRDNPATADDYGLPSHVKRQKLTRASQAGYVCSVDDDDWIAPNYVSAIMAALRQDPDYVGFRVQCTRNGQPWMTADHSLEHQGYDSVDGFFTRDITHLNPIRREYAVMADWTGIIDEDWAAWLRRTGRVRTQVYIDQALYHYRADNTDCFYTSRGPCPEPLPELPEYPWLTVL